MVVYVFRLSHRIGRDKRISTHCGLVSRTFGANGIFYSGEKDESLEKSITMYGLPVQKTIPKIRKVRKDLLVIVGGEKVPGEVYQLADFNISVTSQPHSEVAALAIFLHEYFQGMELTKKFNDAKRKVIPQERGKKVIRA